MSSVGSQPLRPKECGALPILLTHFLIWDCWILLLRGGMARPTTFISLQRRSQTLDDVYCLMHLPIEGHLLDNHGIIYKAGVVDVMVNYIGSGSAHVDYKVISTKGDRAEIT
jgi:hypothetical protein